MTDELISFETAKLAKEKGFAKSKTSVIGVFFDNRYNFEEDYLFHSDKSNCYPAPTQSLLQKWLREKHRIQIFLEADTHKNGDDYYVFHGVYSITIERNFPIGARPTFHTYEQALEKGLQEALKLIT